MIPLNVPTPRTAMRFTLVVAILSLLSGHVTGADRSRLNTGLAAPKSSAGKRVPVNEKTKAEVPRATSLRPNVRLAQAVEVIPGPLNHPDAEPIDVPQMRREVEGIQEVYESEPHFVGESVYVPHSGNDCDSGCDMGVGSCDQYAHATQSCGWDPSCPPLIYIDWRRFDVILGVQGFTGPANYAGLGANLAARDGSGSFGFHEGFNYGRNLPWLLSGELSAQLGLRATQSNLTGAEFTDSARKQLFLTAGIFRRADFGLQGGIVIDYLHDDWYAQLDLTQIRGEISWVTRRAGEFGYRGMFAANKSNATATINDHINAIANIDIRSSGIDQHRLFCRYHFGPVATGELSAGVTNDSDALLGGELRIPLNRSLGMTTGFTMMQPNGGIQALDQQRESWNVFMSFEWRPVGNRQCRDYHLPLFPVGDNGSFLYDVTQ